MKPSTPEVPCRPRPKTRTPGTACKRREASWSAAAPRRFPTDRLKPTAHQDPGEAPRLLLAAFRDLGSAPAQYSIPRHTIDGGVTSTGGAYSVNGTLGQPDAGAMTGGNFSLTGGFWSLYAVQTPGAPLLSILLTTTNTALVSWPSPATGWLLQQNTNSVASVNWSNFTSGILGNGTIKYLIVNPPTGNRFYRLFKP